MGDVKQNAIPYTKERCLKAAIFELVDDHEALKREVNELREHNKYIESRISEESDYAALLTRHNALAIEHAALLINNNALVEAVAWERECSQDIRPLVAWADLYVRHGEDYVDAVADDLRTIQDAARAEVDRLVADCEGEG